MEHPQSTVEQFIDLRAQGMSFASIAKILGVSKPTLIEWSQRHHVTISNYRVMEMTEISEKNYLVKKKRVELLGGTLNRIREELSKRELTDVPTEKLLRYKIECLGLLKREEVPLEFRGKQEHEGVFDSMMPLRDVSWEA